MEPVTATIVAALVAGAVAATKDVAVEAVKDAYTSLKSLIVGKFGHKKDLTEALQKVEQDPQSQGRQIMLEEELTKARAGQDADVIARARELLELLQEHGEKPATTYHEVRSSGAVAQGPGAVAAGERGVAIGGNVQRSTIITGDHNQVEEHPRKDD